MLGNGSSTTVYRSKSKALVVRRVKEIKTAKNYRSIACSPVQSKPACGYSGSMSETFYHNGGSPTPNVNDILYLKKRARSDNKFTAGYYKFLDGKSSFNIQVNSAGVVLARKSC